MNEIVIASDDVDAIRRELLGENIESCAILFAHQVVRSDGTTRFLVRQLLFPDQSDYTRKGPLEAELSPGLVARVTKRAKIDGTSLIFVHSHPGDSPPVFSTIDTFGERRLAKFLDHRHPTARHLALVISAGGTCARELGTQDDVRVIGLGKSRDLLYDPAADENLSLDIYDRQVRAFGAAAPE